MNRIRVKSATVSGHAVLMESAGENDSEADPKNPAEEGGARRRAGTGGGPRERTIGRKVKRGRSLWGSQCSNLDAFPPRNTASSASELAREVRERGEKEGSRSWGNQHFCYLPGQYSDRLERGSRRKSPRTEGKERREHRSGGNVENGPLMIGGLRSH